MSYIAYKEVIEIFALLNLDGLNYILLRNINNELPYNLKFGKDIDILVHECDKIKINNFFKYHGYKVKSHPLRHDKFIYNANKFEFRYNKSNKIIFDLNFQVLVKSLDAGQQIPLDQEIQSSLWENKRFVQLDNNFGYWALGYEDEFVCLLARSILDKREFQIYYRERIEHLLDIINIDCAKKKLYVVFFKFTPVLVSLIVSKKYGDIVESYLKFKDY